MSIKYILSLFFRKNGEKTRKIIMDMEYKMREKLSRLVPVAFGSALV